MYWPDKIKERNATLWGTGLGLWGAISGIALFLTWDSFWRHHPWVAFWELLLAVIAAYVGESARECVEGHEHRQTSIVTSILILVALEFFVLGWHGVAEVESGHLRDVSRRVLGEASTTRAAKLYAFEIRSPDELRLQFEMANSTLTNPDDNAVREMRIKWTKGIVGSNAKTLDLLENKTPDLSAAELSKALAEEETRERVAYRILQLQTPEEQRSLLNDRITEPGLDEKLEATLNNAIESADFFRFIATKNSSEELPELPPVAEMERLNRRAIDRLFSEMITPLPEPDRKEWIDLALGVAPLLFIGLYLGLAMVQLVQVMLQSESHTNLRAATIKGLGYGALVGAAGAFIGFFCYLFLVRMGYFLVSHHPHGIKGTLTMVTSALSYVIREISNCTRPAIQAALMFAFPGATLGAILPWLKPPSRSPKFWSAIALVAAGLAAAVSVFSHNRYWWIVAGSLSAIVILRGIRSGKSIEWYWTTAGVVVALFACAITATAQVTLGSVLTDLHLFIQKPADPYSDWSRENLKNRKGAGLDLFLANIAETQRRDDYFQSPDFTKKYALDQQAQRDEATAVGQGLEICIVGGIGFWVTIASLVAWKIWEPEYTEDDAARELSAAGSSLASS